MRPTSQTLLQIQRVDSCESTNQVVLAAAEAGAPAGSVTVAREQTAGRGRRGRSWLAEPGSTLTFSMLWTFPVDPLSINGLSLAVGVAILRALRHPVLGARRANVRIGLKWPNDILLRTSDKGDAKLGGILIESVTRKNAEGSRELAVVIGVGLNCLASDTLRAEVPEQLIAALADGFTEPERLIPEALLPIVLESLQQVLVEFSESGFAALRDEWQAANLWHGEPVCMTELGQVFLKGSVHGVDSDGALFIATPSGIERVVAGDLSLRKV